jgi:hypothetical protein
MSDAFSNALQKLTERQLHPAACCPDNSSTGARPNNDAATSGLNVGAREKSEHLLRSALDTFTATAHFELSPPETRSATAQPCNQAEPECPTILQHPCAVTNNAAKQITRSLSAYGEGEPAAEPSAEKNSTFPAAPPELFPLWKQSSIEAIGQTPREESRRSTPAVVQPHAILSVAQTPLKQPTPHAESAPACPVLCPEPEYVAPTVKMTTPPASQWVTRNAAVFSSSQAGKLLARLSQSGTANWQKRIEGVLENRRHAAAAVVAVCVAVLWLTAPTTPNAESIPQSEASDMDSILAEFDSADQHRPEPAEPLDTSFEDLIIPQTANASFTTRDFGADTVRAGSNQNSDPEFREESNLFRATPATSATAEDESGQKVRVRLTKSITPLN